MAPPSATALEAAQAALTQKYDDAAALLGTLQTSTDGLAASLEEQRKDVQTELEDFRNVLQRYKDKEAEREEWCKVVGERVEEVVKGLPKVS